MNIAYFIGRSELKEDRRVLALLGILEHSGCGIYLVRTGEDLKKDTDMLLSFGGDGTFLTAAHIAAPGGVPILGVNMGRLGFLSENGPEGVADAILSGAFRIEERDLLQVGGIPGNFPYALNEVSVGRVSPAMLGIDICLDDSPLPTFWADGVLVSTSSGSTAYSLSAGGPICTPDARVLIIAPVSPHNLNLRPLVVPLDSQISISLKARDDSAMLSVDNHSYRLDARAEVSVCTAPIRLRKVCLTRSNFFDALRTRLFWGEDVRNTEN